MNTNRHLNSTRGGFCGRHMPAIWALLTAAALGFAAEGACAEQVEPPIAQKAVSYSDLDLSRAEGAAVLYGRIRAAAWVACSRVESRQVALAIPWRDCMKRAVANAVTRVNRPALEAYYRSKSGGRPSERIAGYMSAPGLESAE